MTNYFPDPSGYAKYMREKDDFAAVKKFAERLHNEFCTLSHIDQCTWEYEMAEGYPKPTWLGFFHLKWFTKAQQLMATGVPEDAIVDIINIHKRY